MAYRDQLLHQPYRAILFDLGDTLLDFAPLPWGQLFLPAAYNTYAHLRDAGCQMPHFRTYYRRQVWTVRRAYVWSLLRRREFNCMDVLRKLCVKNRFPSDESTLQKLGWMWYEPIVKRSSMAEDVLPALRLLRDRGLILGLVSNTSVPGAVLDRHLQMTGLMEFFPDPMRIYSSEVGVRKPHPLIFRKAIEVTGVPASAIVFVGDTYRTDIVGARRMGMKTILRRRPGKKQYPSKADWVISHLHEIPTLLQLTPAALPAAVAS